MRILPYDRFTLETSASIAEIVRHLEPQIEAPKIVRWIVPPNHAPYSGTISEDGFKIRRVIHYRNSFLPQVRGRFESLPDGTAIHITLSLNPIISTFLLLWSLFWCNGLLVFLFSALSSEDVAPETLRWIAFLFILLCLILFISWRIFWFEADRDRRELTDMISTLNHSASR